MPYSATQLPAPPKSPWGNAWGSNKSFQSKTQPPMQMPEPSREWEQRLPNGNKTVQVWEPPPGKNYMAPDYGPVSGVWKGPVQTPWGGTQTPQAPTLPPAPGGTMPARPRPEPSPYGGGMGSFGGGGGSGNPILDLLNMFMGGGGGYGGGMSSPQRMSAPTGYGQPAPKAPTQGGRATLGF